MPSFGFYEVLFDSHILFQTGCRPDITSVGKIKNPINESKKQKNNSDRFVDDEDHPLDVEDRNNSSETIAGSKLFEHKNERRRRDKTLLHNNGFMRRNAIDKGIEASIKNDIEDDGTVLPCEFCGDGYPPSLLLEHQVLLISYHLKFNSFLVWAYF